ARVPRRGLAGGQGGSRERRQPRMHRDAAVNIGDRLRLARQIPNSFRALVFNTFGLISPRISSLAKSAIQRSGVITGQSEPNSILSCKMLLMERPRIGGKFFWATAHTE